MSVVAKALTKSFENIGKCYRIGGDEFAILSNASPSLVNATIEYTREKLRSNKGKYIDAITISAGIENTDSSIEKLLRIADKKMYSDKKDFYSKSNLVETV